MVVGEVSISATRILFRVQRSVRVEKGISDLMNAQTPPPRLLLARSLRTIEKSVRDTGPSGISGFSLLSVIAITSVTKASKGLLIFN